MNEKNAWWLAGGIVVLAIFAIGYGLWASKDTASPTATSTSEYTASSTPQAAGAWISSDDPAVLAAGRDLMSQIKASATDIALFSVTTATWPNGCLGLATAGEICTQAVVPGYDIRFIARGVEFIYHTNESGTVLRMRTPFDVKG